MFHQTGALYALYEIVSNGNASYAFEGDGEVMLLAPELDFVHLVDNQKKAGYA